MRIAPLAAVVALWGLYQPELRAQEEKLPVPDKASQKAALTDIKDLYKQDYAQRDPERRRAFAATLLREGIKSKSDPASCFVLLTEARTLAAEAGAVSTAFSVIGKIEEFFDLEKSPGGESATNMKLDALSKAQRKARRPEEAQPIAAGYLNVAREAAAKGEFKAAQDASRKASSIAKKARDQALVSQTAAFSKVIPELKREYIAAAKVDLSKAIDIGDKRTNLDVGRHLCFVRGNWTKGLEYLQWAGKKELAEAAKADLAKPGEVKAQFDLGEAWRRACEGERSALHKGRYRSRALFWYEEALTTAEGLLRTKAVRALSQLRKEAGIIYLTDLKPTKASVGVGELFMYNGGPVDPKLKVMTEGRRCRNFIFAHADSSLEYNIPLGFSVFSAIGVRRSNLEQEGNFAYKVLVDGKQVYESETLTSYENREVRISVPLPRGAKVIELVVDSLGDGAYDRSVWAYPKFTR